MWDRALHELPAAKSTLSASPVMHRPHLNSLHLPQEPHTMRRLPSPLPRTSLLTECNAGMPNSHPAQPLSHSTGSVARPAHAMVDGGMPHAAPLGPIQQWCQPLLCQLEDQLQGLSLSTASSTMIAPMPPAHDWKQADTGQYRLACAIGTNRTSSSGTPTPRSMDFCPTTPAVSPPGPASVSPCHSNVSPTILTAPANLTAYSSLALLPMPGWPCA